ncbi:MAG: hypothetical protein V7721_04190 [Porticoccaceae bacterium]
MVKNPALLSAAPALPAGFNNVVLPWYSERQKLPAHSVQDLAGREEIAHSLGINVYCPRQTVEDYEQFICQEASLLEELLPNQRITHTLWLRGDPVRQFSPEAITALIYRLNKQFPLDDSADTVRGIELRPSALTDERLALLSGLGFNRINLIVDASIASDDRSLSKLDMAFAHLTNFGQIGVECRILFSSDSHPAFLNRLLQDLIQSGCDLIHLAQTDDRKPQTLAQRSAGANLLFQTLTELSEQNWLALGNDRFIPKHHKLYEASQRDALQLSPWGFQQERQQHWLGLGIEAMGRLHNTYYRTDATAKNYIEAISNRSLPPKTIFRQPPDRTSAFTALQRLLSQHRVNSADFQNLAEATGLLDTPWLVKAGDDYCLTPEGIKNLYAIHILLFTLSNKREL